ncbi:MAG TPA: family 20 glycosylhydrolase [Candidatus Polarisedimenticolaceae bacterium]|nr:family 20 glycosylhydrolase [Candidatus Polarisedimenticolaceae bacterium]
MIDRLVLVPAPRRIVPQPGALVLTKRGTLPKGAGPEVHLGATPGVAAEGYRLVVTPERVVIEAVDAAGVFYAKATLEQVLRGCAGHGAIPAMTIEDGPDFAERGVMLDVSRDKVPTMATLKGAIDLLAALKVNRLQLYVEHTFAYPQHPRVWRDASPLTGAEIETLDAYARERFIELVPNQNSFGHMERWLRLPEYAPLAEVAEPVGDYMSLCPVDPGSLSLLEGLYDAYLPHFSSRSFNVGCDETIDLGKGRSASAVAERGVGRVYLDFLLEIHRLVRERGRRMQFWGDIILEHPDLIRELPHDAVALNWGYEADHPFAAEGEKFAEAGLAYHVCPGTSTWLSLAGRTANAMRNLEAAARAGRANGAVGMLVTDWGDYGHWQPWPVSFLGLTYGAAMAWGAAANEVLDVTRALDLHVFQDEERVLGTLARDLGDVHLEAGVTPKNASVLALLLLFPDRPIGEGRLAGLTVEGLERTLASTERILRPLERARSLRGDGKLIVREMQLAADMVRLACRVGIARLETPGGSFRAISGAIRQALTSDLDDLVRAYRRIWLERNRPGGLPDSIARFERLK